MNNRSKRQLVWGIRILVSALFILSALAKLYPSPVMGIAAFETKYLGAIGIDGGFAKVVSRLLIGLLSYYCYPIIKRKLLSLLLFHYCLFFQFICWFRLLMVRQVIVAVLVN